MVVMKGCLVIPIKLLKLKRAWYVATTLVYLISSFSTLGVWEVKTRFPKQSQITWQRRSLVYCRTSW